MCKAIDIKSNEPNTVFILSIKPEIGKRPLAIKSGTEMCKAIDIKLSISFIDIVRFFFARKWAVL